VLVNDLIVCLAELESHVVVLTLNTQISTKRRFCHVNILDLHLDIIYLAVGLLRSLEFAAGSEEGR